MKKSAKNILELKGISFQRIGAKILDNITWKIKEGQHWALIGPNGSGKTTLLKIASGSIWPSRGTVKILGHEIGKKDIRQIRKKIGWVSPYLAERIPKNQEILDIIISGKFASFGVYEKVTGNDIKKAKELMKFMEISCLDNKTLDLLSEGEKQKVIIARALMAEPLILILDEPCASLDIKSRKNLLSLISKICNKNSTSIIYVTHHIEEIMPEIKEAVLLKHGRILKNGPAKNVLKDEVIEKMFE